MSTIVHLKSPIPRGAISGEVGYLELVIEIRTPGAYADQAALTLDTVYAAARAALEKHGADPLTPPEEEYPGQHAWEEQHGREEDRERERTAELYDVGPGPEPVGTLSPPEVAPWKRDAPPPPAGRPDAPSASSDDGGAS